MFLTWGVAVRQLRGLWVVSARFKVKLAAFGALVLVAALFVVPIASAHTPAIQASISCDGLISFTVKGTNAVGAQLDNPDIGVYVNGVKIFDGAFTRTNNRTFTGTYQVTDFSASTFTVSSKALSAWGDGTAPGESDSTTVTHASNCDSLSTNATGSAAGGTIHDVATVSHAAAVTGKVTFKVFSTSDCSGTALATFSNVAASPSGGNGDGTWTFASGDYTPTGAGTFRWTASIASDSHNASLSEGCNGANETSTVSKATPTITTNATPLTQTITGSGLDPTDTATIAGGFDPTGTITFTLFADASGACGAQVGTSVTVAVDGNGNYLSPSVHVGSAGVYHWVASYGGDGSNNGISGACGDSNENITVQKASPTISTNAAPLSVTIVGGGLDLEDTATLAGGANPSGTITFKLFADNGSGGCGTQVGGSVTTPVSGNDNYVSPSVHVSTVGTYHWVASYGGDGANNAVSGPCGDSNENLTVHQAGPAISTNAAPLSVPLVAGGVDLTDTATLSGAANPTGTITFKLFADANGACGAPIGSPVTAAVNGNGNYLSPSIHVVSAGSYHWVASYGGDGNNGAISGACGDANENVTVAKAGPTITSVASPASATLGGSGNDLTDTATLAGGVAPTGTITFRLFADNGNGGCGTQVGSSATATANGNGSYTSPSIHIGSAGSYHWIASYGGDGNNSAVSGACGDPNENVTLTPPPPTGTPAISITKSPTSQTIASGATANFTITVTNTGTLVLSNVSVSDPLSPNCNQAVASMAIGASVTYNCSLANVTSGFTNLATATGTGSNAQTVTAVGSAAVIVTPPPPPAPAPTPHPSIGIVNNPSSQAIGQGGTAQFTITVTNTGDVTLSDVKVTDPLSPSCGRSLGTLAAGQSQHYSCTKTNVSSDFENVATATGKPPTTAAVDATDQAHVTVKPFIPPQHPKIAIVKSPKTQTLTTTFKTVKSAAASTTTVTYGTAHFTIKVTNTGDVTLHSVNVSDPASPGCNKTIGTLASHASKTYTCSRSTVTVGFTNVATAHGTSPKGVRVEDADHAKVKVTVKTAGAR